ncbi:MAG: SLBB domain-containing protein, partial [Candidatus Omnitrophica bacterium]|nr:SLBB domain-containing protein [Candidatus Omnitrophota bacterium]
ERIESNERRVMIDIELKKTDIGKFFLEDIKIQNGDLVIVSPIVRLKHDFVSIIGNVERPGDYGLTKNMKVTDLIARAKGFMPATYISRLEIARVTNDRARQIIPVNLQDIKLGEKGEDIALEEWDIILIYSASEVTPPSFVDIDGAVNRPGKYELTPQMKISDLIFRAGSVKSGEVIRGAELFHIIPGEQPVVRDIGIKQVSDTNIFVDKDIILRSGDAIFVKSEPKLTERRIISLKGEVKYPGTYSIRKGERLSSLVERAGDFTDEAFLDGAMFNRESIKEAQEKIRQQFLAREQRAILEEQQAILLRTSSSGIVTATSDPLKMRQEMIEIIASAEIEGRMVIVLKPLSQLKGTKDDILLEDGDVLKVPQMPSGVAVIGSVNNPTTIPFESGRGIEYYMRKTGGLTKHADKQGIYVIKANGEAVSKFMMSKSVERGATIVVPQEFKYWTPPGQLLKDTVEILSRIAMGVGIIAALQ